MFGLLARGENETSARQTSQETLRALGIDHLGDRIALHLSGGEKKLAALAGILATEPKVMLLDEPTNGLDETAQERLLQQLGAIDKSMIIVSHHRSFVTTLADTIYRFTPSGLIREG